MSCQTSRAGLGRGGGGRAHVSISHLAFLRDVFEKFPNVMEEVLSITQAGQILSIGNLTSVSVRGIINGI